MADKKTYTGLSKNYATVPAFSITTIDYLDTKPNYFRVQNRGTTELYCSTNNMPTTKHYDFAVPGKKMKMFAEPYNRTRLYIFNPSGTDVEVAVLSFQAEFEPLTLALSEIEVEVPSNFETSTAITSFNASLPTGNNKIGKVEVTNGPNQVDVTAIKESTAATVTALNELMSAPASGHINLGNIAMGLEILLAPTEHSNGVNLASIIAGMRYMLEKDYVTNVSTFDAKDQNNVTYLYQGDSAATSMKCHIHMLTNDGTGDLQVNIKGKDDTNIHNITLKSGESITDFKVDCILLYVSGTNYSYRAMITYLEGGGV